MTPQTRANPLTSALISVIEAKQRLHHTLAQDEALSREQARLAFARVARFLPRRLSKPNEFQIDRAAATYVAAGRDRWPVLGLLRVGATPYRAMECGEVSRAYVYFMQLPGTIYLLAGEPLIAAGIFGVNAAVSQSARMVAVLSGARATHI